MGGLIIIISCHVNRFLPHSPRTLHIYSLYPDLYTTYVYLGSKFPLLISKSEPWLCIPVLFTLPLTVTSPLECLASILDGGRETLGLLLDSSPELPPWFPTSPPTSLVDDERFSSSELPEPGNMIASAVGVRVRAKVRVREKLHQ